MDEAPSRTADESPWAESSAGDRAAGTERTEDEGPTVESMCEKLNGATDASRRLAYRKFPRGPRDLSFLGDKIESLVWAYADGLYYEFHWKHAQGRTSLAEMLAYDMEKWERTTEIHRALFESLLIGVEKREAQVGKEGDRREEKSADQARGEESPTGGETHP